MIPADIFGTVLCGPKGQLGLLLARPESDPGRETNNDRSIYFSIFDKKAYLHVCICIITDHPILRTFPAFLAILGSAKTAYFNVSPAYLLSIRFERTYQVFWQY